MITYEIGVRVPIRKLCAAAQDVEDSINRSMEGFGISERLVITSVVPFTLTVGREPTDHEMGQMKKIICDNCAEEFGNAEIEYCKVIPKT